ncbi:LysR family transcriptional regulator [Holdemanella biformis]
MTLDYYRIFYYVAKYKSFSKAAKILHNNQPNISRTMNNIESEFGCKLLVRSHSGITLTPEGEQLYEHVAIAIEQLYQGESEILSNKTLEHGHISIGVSETALNIFLLSKLEHFHKAYPHVKIKLSNHSSIQAVDALEKGIVDIAVVTSPINIKKPLHTTSLYCFEEILIGGKEYENLSNEILDIQQISHYPFITLGKNTSTYTYYSNLFLNHKIPFHTDLEVATADQIFPLVKHNLGIGFYPKELISKDSDIFEIQTNIKNPEREILLVQDASRATNIATQKFIDTLSL